MSRGDPYTVEIVVANVTKDILWGVSKDLIPGMYILSEKQTKLVIK